MLHTVLLSEADSEHLVEIYAGSECRIVVPPPAWMPLGTAVSPFICFAMSIPWQSEVVWVVAVPKGPSGGVCSSPSNGTQQQHRSLTECCVVCFLFWSWAEAEISGPSSNFGELEPFLHSLGSDVLLCLGERLSHWHWAIGQRGTKGNRIRSQESGDS